MIKVEPSSMISILRSSKVQSFNQRKDFMHTKLKLLLFALLMSLAHHGFSAQFNVGQKVFVQYSNGIWYKAEITGGSQNSWKVKYQSDGSEQSELSDAEVIDRNSAKAKSLSPADFAESDFEGNKPQKMKSDASICVKHTSRSACQREAQTSCSWQKNHCDGTYK